MQLIFLGKQLIVTEPKILQARKSNYSATAITIFIMDPVATGQTELQATLIQEFIILLQSLKEWALLLILLLTNIPNLKYILYMY